MDPFHEGERRAHELAGSQDDARRNAGMIAETILPGAARFMSKLALVGLASVEEGRLRASPILGEPGFLSATARSVEVDLARVAPDPEGPLARAVGSRVGLLAIDLGTRARYRVNGALVATDDARRLRIETREAFPNCPQYIQKRRLVAAAPRAERRPSLRGETLGAAQVALVARTDTTFVASGHPERGLDASHRGGKPGFVEVLAPDRLRIPDYSGNGLFQTLGNLLVDPRAAIAFLDFEGERILEVTGRASVQWNGERSWELAVERFTERDLPLALSWTDVEASPDNPSSCSSTGPRGG